MRTSSCWFSARISVRVESGEWFLEWRQAPNSEQQPVSRFRDDFSPAKLGRTESCKVCPAIFDADPRTFEFECESLRGLTVTVPFPRSRRPYAQTNVVRELTAIICNPRESIDMHCRVIHVPLSACLIL